jgi:folate-binding protein YgfZ
MFSLTQYEAARQTAVMFDADWRGLLRVAGGDRRTFLHALLTNDVETLAAGKGTYAAYLTPQGRMISDMTVLETGSEVLMQVEQLVAAPLAQRLDKLVFSEDVQVSDLAASSTQVSVLGPAALETVARATELSLSGLRSRYDNVGAFSDGLVVVLDDSWGIPRCDLLILRANANTVRERLAESGAVPTTLETVEVLRVEAGYPRFGIDMTTDTIPLEAGLEASAISFTKGCYVGQEVIVRVLHRGHGRVARRLVGLVLEDGPTPGAHDPILSAGSQAGEVTSAAESPLVSKSIALGYVQRELANEGTEVTINGSVAHVHLLPFAR